MLRAIAPAGLVIAVVIAVSDTTSTLATAVAVAVTLIVAVLAADTEVAFAAANAVAYGNEQRYPLRVPPALFAGPLPVARALAVMRRTYGDAIPFIPVIKVGGLEIDLLNQQVRAGALKLNLTTIEQALLYLLASNPGKTLNRETILDALWGADYVAESNLVDRHIRNLRVKLKDSWRRPRYIETLPGKGYRFLATA